jgi:hypothetical protein
VKEGAKISMLHMRIQVDKAVMISSRYCPDIGSRDSIVGIPTSYELDDRGDGVRVPVGSRIFST